MKSTKSPKKSSAQKSRLSKGHPISRDVVPVVLPRFFKPRLGVNIDHIATLRQLRGTPYPNLLEAAQWVAKGGGEQITIHLREDRRHIQDEDAKMLRKHAPLPINLEMAVAPEMVRIACQLKPDWVCLVPEKRQEVTTEGGLNVSKNLRTITQAIEKLKKAKIRVSCFIEPSLDSVRLSQKAGADAVEFHTGRFCLGMQKSLGKNSAKIASQELKRLKEAALFAQKLGLHAHAGHGFDYTNVRPVVELENSNRSPLIEEYNIGHAIVCRAAMVGLERAVREMVSAIVAP